MTAFQAIADAIRALSTSFLVTWKGQATDSAGTPATLPKKFTVNLSPFIGAWTAGEEPRLEAKFSIRPIPPKDATNPIPSFRVCWINAAEYELAAQNILATGVQDQIEAVSPGLDKDERVALYLGKPAVTHRILPKASDG